MSLKIAHDVNEKDRTEDIKIKENVDFSAMLLSENVLRGLKKCGYLQPSPIQLKAIPLGRCGFDLIIKAKSGTGKTAVFVITALEMIDISKNHPQVVILAPTREIAVQIQQVVKHIGSEFQGLGVEYFIGGTPLSEDEIKLQNCHIVVGAPGRIRHLIEKKLLDVSLVRLFVLDEADKLMEISFQQSINWIYNQLPKRKQVLAVSATYPDDLDKFLGNYMLSPTHVSPDTKMPILLGIRQFYTVVNSHLNAIQQMKFKTDELTKILSNLSFNQCLVFSNYQTRAESLSNNLNHQGWPSRFISGQQSQTKRLQAVDDLRKFKCRILSSTDLTARGIDAANVDLVVNYDVPLDVETYLHRMGRAGRYGSYGICITIASNGKELKNLQKIIKQLGNNVAIAKLPDTKYFKDIWHCDFNELEHLHCSDDEEGDTPIVSQRNNRLTAGESPKKSRDSDSNSDENSKSNLNEKVSNLICNQYNSKVNESDISSVSQILKSVESQTSGKNIELNLTPSIDILKKLAKGNLQSEGNIDKKMSFSEKSCQSIGLCDVAQNTDNKTQLRAGCFDTNEFCFTRGPPTRPSVSENVEQYCAKQVLSPEPSNHDKQNTKPETVNQNRILDTTYYEEVSLDTRAYKELPSFQQRPQIETKRSRIPQRSYDTQTQPFFENKIGQKDDVSQKSFQSERKRWKSDKMMTSSEKFYVNRSRDSSPETNLKFEETKTIEPYQGKSFYSTENDIVDTFFSKSSTDGNRLLFNAPCLEKTESQNEMTVDNLTSKNESNLNTLLGKNIALFKITKLVMENKFCDTLIKDCSKEVNKLLETLHEEDDRQIKSYTIDDIKNFLDKNKIGELASRLILGGFSQNMGSTLTPGCCDDLFCRAYDNAVYSQHSIRSEEECCCCPDNDQNENISSRPSAMDVDEDYMCTEKNCKSQCVKAHCDALRSRIERIEENLFSKAYDRAINGPGGHIQKWSNLENQTQRRRTIESQQQNFGLFGSRERKSVSLGGEQQEFRTSVGHEQGHGSLGGQQQSYRRSVEQEQNFGSFVGGERKSGSLGGQQQYKRSVEQEYELLKGQERQFGSLGEQQQQEYRRSLEQEQRRGTFEGQERKFESLGGQQQGYRMSVEQEQEFERQEKQFGSLGVQQQQYRRSVGQEQSFGTSEEQEQRPVIFEGRKSGSLKGQVVKSESFIVPQRNFGSLKEQQQNRTSLVQEPENGANKEYEIENEISEEQEKEINAVPKQRSSLLKTIKRKFGSLTGHPKKSETSEEHEIVYGISEGQEPEDGTSEEQQHASSRGQQQNYGISEEQELNYRTFEGQTDEYDDDQGPSNRKQERQVEKFKNNKEASTEPFGFEKKFLEFTNNKSDKSIQSFKSSKHAYVSPELQNFVERRNVYTSYYQHYSNVLHESAPSFSDVHEFRDWFSKWREEVEAVRDFVQQDIYQHECDKDE